MNSMLNTNYLSQKNMYSQKHLNQIYAIFFWAALKSNRLSFLCVFFCSDPKKTFGSTICALQL